MRLFNADDVLKRLAVEREVYVGGYPFADGVRAGLASAAYIVENANSEELIRCEACALWDKAGLYGGSLGECRNTQTVTMDTDYCSYAVRNPE